MPIEARRVQAAEESNLANRSLAGVRPLAQAEVAVSAGSAGSYVVTLVDTRRVVLFHSSGADTDIRVDMDPADDADANDMPVASGTYFVLEAVKDEVVRLFNTSGGSITVNVMEIT